MIRRATDTDRTAVVAMIRRFHDVAAVPFSFGAAYAEAIFKNCLGSDGLCLILDQDGPCGVFMAQVGRYPFGPDRVASEIVWWIDEGVRGHGLKMLDAYEAWAREHGCAFAGLVSLSDNDLARLYRRRGYRPIEMHFLKAL